MANSLQDSVLQPAQDRLGVIVFVLLGLMLVYLQATGKLGAITSIWQNMGTSPTGGSPGNTLNAFGSNPTTAGSGTTTMQQAASMAGVPQSWATDPALWQLLQNESGSTPTQLNNTSQNPTSTAYGIFQFLNGTWPDTGYQKTSDPLQQSAAGLTYIKNRYGTPTNALNFWNNNKAKSGSGWY